MPAHNHARSLARHCPDRPNPMQRHRSTRSSPQNHQATPTADSASPIAQAPTKVTEARDRPRDTPGHHHPQAPASDAARSPKPRHHRRLTLGEWRCPDRPSLMESHRARGRVHNPLDATARKLKRGRGSTIGTTTRRPSARNAAPIAQRSTNHRSARSAPQALGSTQADGAFPQPPQPLTSPKHAISPVSLRDPDLTAPNPPARYDRATHNHRSARSFPQTPAAPKQTAHPRSTQEPKCAIVPARPLSQHLVDHVCGSASHCRVRLPVVGQLQQCDRQGPASATLPGRIVCLR